MTRPLWRSDALNGLLEPAKKKTLVDENIRVGESWEGMHAATRLWVLSEIVWVLSRLAWLFHFRPSFKVYLS